MNTATKEKAIAKVVNGLHMLGYNADAKNFTIKPSNNRLYPNHAAVIDITVNRIYYVKI